MAEKEKMAFEWLCIAIPQGKKAAIQAAAEQAGESFMTYVNKAIQAHMGLKDWPEIPTRFGIGDVEPIAPIELYPEDMLFVLDDSELYEPGISPEEWPEE